MATEQWWRVIIDADGYATAEPVNMGRLAGHTPQGSDVLFVQAASKELALRMARESHNLYNKWRRGEVRKTASETQMSCVLCSREPEPGKLRCALCNKQKLEAKQRHRREGKKETKKHPVSPRTNVLQDVLRRLDEEGAEALRAWIIGELDRLEAVRLAREDRGRKAADEAASADALRALEALAGKR